MSERTYYVPLDNGRNLYVHVVKHDGSTRSYVYVRVVDPLTGAAWAPSSQCPRDRIMEVLQTVLSEPRDYTVCPTPRPAEERRAEEEDDGA